MPKYSGVEYDFGDGVKWTIPAINLRDLKNLQSKIALVDMSNTSAETLDTVVECVRAALARNYPEITLDDVYSMVDLRNLGEVFSIVMGQSGLSEKKNLAATESQ